MILRLFQFALVLVLLVVVAMVSALTTMHFAIHGAEVKVPDFHGLSEADARRKAAATGKIFTIKTVTSTAPKTTTTMFKTAVDINCCFPFP